ncbi:uracil-DNA glycosylase [Candidatus Saccharibacteria bacterium 32-49-12]|nr:MAG: uracil-DNA glycosylase [Candidatus Saccharibacteria bacterium 32-49-12]
MEQPFEEIRQEIANHPSNRLYLAEGYWPLFLASQKSKIVIVGQAPGVRAQLSGMVWNDASGQRLIRWLGVDEEQFRDLSLFAHLPMGFYYPGKGKTGDLPPRKDFAQMWHEPIMKLMPEVQLFILIGKYAQQYYLQSHHYPRLTDTVRSYQQYLPRYFPLVHPSPLNFRWFMKNEWFEAELVPELQKQVARIISS